MVEMIANKITARTATSDQMQIDFNSSNARADGELEDCFWRIPSVPGPDQEQH
jgi:hypothetical protein